jgi:hypothetical protein
MDRIYNIEDSRKVELDVFEHAIIRQFTNLAKNSFLNSTVCTQKGGLFVANGTNDTPFLGMMP